MFTGDINIDMRAIDWFGSYLTSRYQYVRIDTTLSIKLPVSSGVPQESILSPLLLNIYVGDHPFITKSTPPSARGDSKDE